MSPITNVQKTDEEIKTDVVNELRWDSRVDASKIEVRVDDGLVTLRGEVPSYGSRADAAIDASSVLGVLEVDNQLDVKLPMIPPVPSDETIESKARNTLEWNPDVDSTNVRIKVDAGVVNLTGTVPTHWEKTRSEALVGDLRGVLALENELGVVPTEAFSDEAIAEDVIAALERSVLVDAGRVDVTVSDGVVTLNGSVPSAAARRAAHRAASRTAGVVNVQNNVTISV